MSIQTYSDASDYLGSKTDRPLPGRATRLQRRSPDAIAVRYQSTDVITYRADGTIVLDSGGWQTSTTKVRIVEYTRARVWQTKGTWYLATGHAYEDRPVSLFYDGMVVDDDGKPLAPRTDTAAADRRRLDRAISAYIRGFSVAISAGEIGQPSSGDCWGCSMTVVDAPAVSEGPRGRVNRPTPHGRIEPMGVDHYLSHVEEAYYVPSLLANAIVARGYADPGFIWHMTVVRKDGRMAGDILRAYFRTLKPALYRERGLLSSSSSSAVA